MSPLSLPEKPARSDDTGPLPGSEILQEVLNGTTLGRAADAVFEEGTEKLFSRVEFRAALASLPGAHQEAFTPTPPLSAR